MRYHFIFDRNIYFFILFTCFWKVYATVYFLLNSKKLIFLHKYFCKCSLFLFISTDCFDCFCTLAKLKICRYVSSYKNCWRQCHINTPLVFEICKFLISKMFAYKHTEAIEYVKKQGSFYEKKKLLQVKASQVNNMRI